MQSRQRGVRVLRAEQVRRGRAHRGRGVRRICGLQTRPSDLGRASELVVTTYGRLDGDGRDRVFVCVRVRGLTALGAYSEEPLKGAAIVRTVVRFVWGSVGAI